MRGDSLRDLYAKTLALVGLTVLAGVGALVDYWPVALTFPAPPVPILLPDPADRTLVAHEPIDVILASDRAGRPPAEPRLARSRVSLVLPAQAESNPPLGEPALSPASALPDPVTVVANNGLSSISGPTEIVTSIPDSPVTLDESWTDATDSPLPMRAAVAGVSGGDDSDGMISGAFKKTGSSIIKTGARTGASIFDAMRVVSGVVRRALPTD